jgi:putative transposase
MIDRADDLPVTRKCELLELSRSSIYYQLVPLSAKDLELMRQIDEIHLAYPFYGSRKIRNALWASGHDVGCVRVRRLMRRMDIEALYCQPTSNFDPFGHRKMTPTCS